MNILVTSGSTITPIDRVRGITNIFNGRTGFSIANEAVCRGHSVTLLGNPIAKEWLNNTDLSDKAQFNLITYRTFDQLEDLMRKELGKLGWDACIHSAAVSDYKLSQEFESSEDVYNFVKTIGHKENATKDEPVGKISSRLDELWLRLVPTKKLVDSIREWGLGDGTLVKFKLEVNVSDDELYLRARKSREESKADFIVANRLEDFNKWDEPSMQIIDKLNNSARLSRNELPFVLLDRIEER